MEVEDFLRFCIQMLSTRRDVLDASNRDNLQVTEGGQRTMRTHLAAASGLASVSQLPSEWLEGCKLLHLEGYVLYRPKLAEEAMQAARKHDSLVGISKNEDANSLLGT